MKAAVLTDSRTIEVQDVPEPDPGADQIKVKIAYCGVCGSELHLFDPEFARSRPPMQQRSGPRIMGHEACGIISAVGSAVERFKVGQRVAMNFRGPCGACYYCRSGKEHFCEKAFPATGGYAEYALYKENMVYALPENVSLEEGALLEPVSVAVHTIDLANIRPGGSVAIIGGGPIGLLVLELALKAGAARILVSEPAASRRQMAKQLGAHVVVDPLNEDLEEIGKKFTESRGFDTVIEAVGKLAVAEQAVSLADKGGTIVWAAMYPQGAKAGVEPAYMYSKELSIRSVFISPYCFPRAMNLLPEMELKPLISVMPIENINQAFRQLIQGQGIKILIKP